MLISKTKSFHTTLDGESAFGTASRSATTGQLPNGIAVRDDIETTADLSAATSLASGIGESIEGDFTGSFSASAKLGLSAAYGPMTMGVSHGFTSARQGGRDHRAGVSVSWKC